MKNNQREYDLTIIFPCEASKTSRGSIKDDGSSPRRWVNLGRVASMGIGKWAENPAKAG